MLSSTLLAGIASSCQGGLAGVSLIQQAAVPLLRVSSVYSGSLSHVVLRNNCTLNPRRYSSSPRKNLPTKEPQHRFSPTNIQACTPKFISRQLHGETSAQYDESVSLRAFLKRTVAYTAAAIGGTTVSCALFAQIPLVIHEPLITLGVGFVGAIGSIIGMHYVDPTFTTENGIQKAIDPPSRIAFFSALTAFEGLTLSPLIAMVAETDPTAIALAGVASVCVMAGMASYALYQPTGSLLPWGPALNIGLTGLISVGLINIFALHSHGLFMVESFAGVALFSGLTAYYTHLAIEAHNTRQPDHLLLAAQFYLNFLNLFIRLLAIIARARDSS